MIKSKEFVKTLRKNDISVAKKSLEFLNQELQNTTQVERFSMIILLDALSK